MDLKAEKERVCKIIRKEKAIFIFRNISPERLVPAVEQCRKVGVRLVEITFDMTGKIPEEQTAKGIAALKYAFGDEICVGAGTVLTTEQARLAREAGSAFIISPVVNREVSDYCLKNGIVSIPGAMTPSEIYSAYCLGADFVKIFPAGALGPDYLKEIRGPLPHIPLVVTGGVGWKNAADYLHAGAVGIGVGGSAVKTAQIEAGEYGETAEACKKVLLAVRQAEAE